MARKTGHRSEEFWERKRSQIERRKSMGLAPRSTHLDESTDPEPAAADAED